MCKVNRFTVHLLFFREFLPLFCVEVSLLFEKNLKIGRLLDFYGEILSDRKRLVLEYYYNDDLSLSEIADEIGISRQGVRDSIKKGEDELLFFEEKLGLAARFSAYEEAANRIRALSEQETLSKELRAEISKLSEFV